MYTEKDREREKEKERERERERERETVPATLGRWLGGGLNPIEGAIH